ncbi:MAG: peptidase domain-containing ABC transporter [Acidobacteriota bacterium]|nr:peptidase domain-containing ABC transporter [Acidobacteriota bacterium]
MFKLFLQDSPNDCGAACLASILNHHGLYITPVDLAEQMEFSRAGTSNVELQSLAARFGLETRLINLPVTDFHRLTDPCIAYVAGDTEGLLHNVVITRLKGSRLHIADPGRGSYWTTVEQFAEGYQGLLLILRPTSEFRKGVVSETYLKRFLKFVIAWRAKIILCLAVGFLAGIIGFGLIYLSKQYVDRVLPSGEISRVFLFAGIYFLARLLSLAATGFNHIYTVVLRNQVSRVLSQRYFDHVLALEKRQLDNRHAGDYMQQYTGIDTLTEGIAGYFGQFILVVLGILVKAGYLIWLYDPGLVAIVLLILVCNAGAGFLFSALTAEQTNRLVTVFGEITESILTSLADIRVIRVFGASAWLLDRYHQLLAEGLTLTRKLTTLQVAGRSLADVLSIVSDAAIFLICGMRIIDGSYTVGDFVLFLAFAQGLTNESREFPALILTFHAQLRTFARIQSIFRMPPERNGVEALQGEGLEIEFRHVSFAYHKGLDVLQDVSFVIPRNSCCAFVGESGSGKTTVMNLIMGFYPPQQGQILINGRDLNELDLKAYRKRISTVFQDTLIFSKSLLNNVTMGDDAIEEKRVQETAELLGADRFIQKMALGLRQPIYAGAISGGQTQQVGILRAMSKPFDLLVLDEATSHLDSRTEERIVKGIDAVCKGKRTRAIIAHRLSTVKAADQIIVMKQGRVVEKGNHRELVDGKGYYLELIERQYEVNLVPHLDPDEDAG